MTFIEAVKICFKKYVDFDGCAARPEFWWWVLFTFIATMALETISRDLSGLFSIATCLPGIAVAARRLHDTDRSAWFLLLWFIPIVGWILLIIWFAEASKPSRYGNSAQGSAAS